jgi:hypothetical protein
VDILLLQLILWFGMLFLIWALKDSLGGVESTIDNAGDPPRPPFESPAEFRFSRAEQVREPIGSYDGAQIFRYARIEGKNYQFEHICVNGQPAPLGEGQRCLAPGLVYSEC